MSVQCSTDTVSVEGTAAASRCSARSRSATTKYDNTSVTSGQRTQTSGRIALALDTPAAGESIPKPRCRREAPSPADKSAAPCCCGVCCLHSLIRRCGSIVAKN